MEVLRMKNIEKQINSRHILQIPELILHHGERIGIVGSNGVGKTTLLRMIIQEDNDYKGMITVNGDIAYVPQVKEIRDGSGGEISLKLLKEAFSSRTSILILDEPTSHLDQHNVQWLIHRISKFDGTIILVSHDRFLLDNIIEKIVFIERSQIGVFKGNFTEFENERNQIEEQCWKNIAQYNNEVARLTKELENKKIRSKKISKKSSNRISNSDWKARSKMGSYDSQEKAMAKSAKAIEKRLSRLTAPSRPSPKTQIKFKTISSTLEYSSNTMIELKESKLSTNFIDLYIPQIKMRFGEKWLLTGRNKSGKTTLLKSIVNQEIDGYFSKGLKIGYFSQELNTLDQDKTLFDNIYETSSHNKQLIINFLAMLDLKFDKIFVPFVKLSGGEQVKGQLASVLLSDSNFLILDEPTNFLDITSLNALEKFLLSYPGSILLVCHDTYFQERLHFKKLCILNNNLLLEDYFED